MNYHKIYKTLRTVPGTWSAGCAVCYYYFTGKEVEAQRRIRNSHEVTLLELEPGSLLSPQYMSVSFTSSPLRSRGTSSASR